MHEDWGATPAQIDTCLTVAEAAGLPVALHTDTLNESGYLADTIAATAGRTVHAYHVEGGGGHPDVLSILNFPHVLGSSTTPTLPLTVATVDELLPMTMTVHKLHGRLASDRGIAASRIRRHGIAAENLLHDLGAISIVNSDSMGMGRIAEVARRTWQLAHVQATLAGETGPTYANNARVLQLPGQAVAQPGDRARHGRARGVAGGRAAGGHRAVGPRPVRHHARAGAEVRVRRLGRVRLRVGLDPDHPAAGRCGPYFGGLGDAPRSLSVQFVAGAGAVDVRPAGLAARRGPLPADRRGAGPDPGGHGAQRVRAARRGAARGRARYWWAARRSPCTRRRACR